MHNENPATNATFIQNNVLYTKLHKHKYYLHISIDIVIIKYFLQNKKKRNFGTHADRKLHVHMIMLKLTFFKFNNNNPTY